MPELDPEQIDPLCQYCQEHNEPGGFFCGQCGKPLPSKSENTTQSLTQPLPQTPESEAATTTVDEDCEKPSYVRTYEGSSDPSEWFQQKMINASGESLRQVINLMNIVRHVYMTSPAKKGRGMNENRLKLLIEIRNHLSLIDRSMQRLVSQEFKAKK
jgi:hypothetical protein